MYKSLVAMVVLLFLTPCSRALANANAIQLPWQAGWQAGLGFDSVSGSMNGLGSAFDANSLSFRPDVCPFERKFDLELVASLEEFTRKIGVRAEAEINAVVASATGTLEFANTTIRNDHNVYLMLRDERINCHYTLDAPR